MLHTVTHFNIHQAFFLDNTIKCENPKDRGLYKWLQTDDECNEELEAERLKVYNMPGFFGRIKSKRLCKIMPIFSDHQKSNSSQSTTDSV